MRPEYRMGTTELVLWCMQMGACGIVMIGAGVNRRPLAILLSLTGVLICHFVIGLTPRKGLLEDD